MQAFFELIVSFLKKLIAFLKGQTAVDRPADPGAPEEPVVDPGEVVCYYGCPNSKKAKKLQLNKRPVK